ncbi:hypothetical protein EVA_09312 [gut metagenome]|uniref:Uncharacterized protein n=1 Tax=gut metagenome TaxID=749906 RepID=J9G5V9_9ZZZZ
MQILGQTPSLTLQPFNVAFSDFQFFCFLQLISTHPAINQHNQQHKHNNDRKHTPLQHMRFVFQLFLTQTNNFHFFLLGLIFHGPFGQLCIKFGLFQAIRLCMCCFIIPCCFFKLLQGHIILSHVIINHRLRNLHVSRLFTQQFLLHSNALPIASQIAEQLVLCLQKTLHLRIGCGQTFSQTGGLCQINTERIPLAHLLILIQQIGHTFQHDSGLLLFPSFRQYLLQILHSFLILAQISQNATSCSSCIHHHIHVLTFIR